MTTTKGLNHLIKAIKDQEDLNIIESLIEDVADIDAVPKTCYNSIKQYNEAKINRMYIEQGYTPLHHAVQTGNINIVKLLLKHGANINVNAGNCKRALDVAVDVGNVEIIRLLLENGAESDFTNNTGCTNIIDADIVGCTHLHFAAEHGYAYIEVIKFLLEKGDNINVTDEDGSTPLHYVAYMRSWEHEKLIKFMIEHGADINATNKFGQTPLHLAVCGVTNCTTTVQLLLEYGSKIDVADNNGYKPVDLASNNGHTKVVKLLELEQLINSRTIDLKQPKEGDIIENINGKFKLVRLE